MKSLIIFIILIAITGFNKAISQNDTIVKSNGGWSLNSRRLTAQELRTELLKVPQTQVYVKRSKTHKIISITGYIAGLGFALLSQTNNDSYVNKENTGYKIAAIVCLSTSIVFTFSSRKNIKRAVNVYNSR